MRSVLRMAAVLSAIATTSLAGQQPGQPIPGAAQSGSVLTTSRPEAGAIGVAMVLPAAKMLLANSAELDLTDAQVLKLAAIARRSEARRRSMRAALDSVVTRFSQPGDPVALDAVDERARINMNRMRDQFRLDQRDAIAVLTPDQQATAWEMIASHAMAWGQEPIGARLDIHGGEMGGTKFELRAPDEPRRVPQW
jgi:hypothetical protein